MGRLTRWASSAAVVALALSVAACGDSGPPSTSSDMAAECSGGTILRLALNQTEEHPSYIALDSFSEELQDNTEGFYIDIYPNEILGAQAEALQLVSDGIVDMAIVSGAQLENLNSDFLVLNLPLAFDDVDHQMATIHDPEVTGELFTSLEQSNGFTVLGGFTQGTRSVYAPFPVETPADLAGMKIRVQESPVAIAMAQALGGSGTPMAYGELYSGLQSGVVDAAENNEVSWVSQRHFEVAPYLSMTKHLVGLDYLIINTDKLASMCPAEREIFDQAWEHSFQYHTELWEESTNESVALAESEGATVVEVDEESFREPLEQMASRFLRTDSQQALWDSLRATSTQQ